MGDILYIIMILVVAILLLLTRLYFLKKEIKNVSNQVYLYNMEETEKKVDLDFLEKDLERLAMEINKLIALHGAEKSKKKRFENELKQAVANMSHDLRTPLTSIVGYLQMLELNDVAEEKQEYITTAKNQAKRLQILLNDFFELTIIESADNPLHVERINVNRIILNVLLGFYDHFNEKQLEPDIQIPEQTINITSDESAVTRVIENLISNAVTYSSDSVSVILEQKQSKVILTIRNDIDDLTEKDVALFFDRFYTADQTRTGKGTGLGLSIAKSLMLKMNGNLTAEYKNGQVYFFCEWKLK